VIVRLRTVRIPPEPWGRFIDWIEENPALHSAVHYRPLTRHDVAGGHIYLDGPAAVATSPKEASP